MSGNEDDEGVEDEDVEDEDVEDEEFGDDIEEVPPPRQESIASSTIEQLQKRVAALEQANIELTRKLKYPGVDDPALFSYFIETDAVRLRDVYNNLRSIQGRADFAQIYGSAVSFQPVIDLVGAQYAGLKFRWEALMAEMKPTFKWADIPRE